MTEEMEFCKGEKKQCKQVDNEFDEAWRDRVRAKIIREYAFPAKKIPREFLLVK